MWEQRTANCSVWSFTPDKDEICRRFSVDRQYLRVLVHRAKARFQKKLTLSYTF